MTRNEPSPAATPPPPFVAITGFMGTGKTETAAALAGMLGLELIDTDRLIEERTGRTVPEIFRDDGEARFRELEAGVCKELTERRNLVVATGGGMLVDTDNFTRLDGAGTVVLLKASVEAIVARVGTNRDRPLLYGDQAPSGSLEGRVRKILTDRESAYGRISFRVDTTDISPRQAAAAIAARLNLPARSQIVRVPPGSLRPFPGAAGAPARQSGSEAAECYTIATGRGLLSKLGDFIVSLGKPSLACVMMPDKVERHHRDQVAAALDATGLPWREIPLRDGDGEKNWDQVQEILEAFAAAGAARDSVAVAVGGGVTGDMGGFAAAAYMRGIPIVQVPTTLLAQVDASIGGKVGVNLRRGKNLAGCFHQPHLVLIDPCVLRTLPGAEIANGMAEVVKTALIGDAGLFDFIEKELAAKGAEALSDTAFLERCVAACSAVKGGIVERDPFEAGERRILNLGHTLGHAFETLGNYRDLTHGQAVSIGTVAACRIAAARGLIDEDLVRRTRDMLEQCGLPVAPPQCDEAELFQALSLDKKKRAGRLHFILPEGIGKIIVVDDVSEDEIRAAIS